MVTSNRLIILAKYKEATNAEDGIKCRKANKPEI